MKRARRFVSTLGVSILLVACGSSGSDAPFFVTPETHTFQACGSIYFTDNAGNTAGMPVSLWTVGVMDHPEIATSVTGASGCAKIALPAESEEIVTFTKPGWVPSAMTVRMGDVDIENLHAAQLQGFSALPPWWWGSTQGNSTGDLTPGSTGIVAVLTAVAPFDPTGHGTAVMLPERPILRTEDGTARTDWLWVGPRCSTYCQRQTPPNPDYPPTGAGVLPNVPEGIAEVEIPGASCTVDPAKGAEAWPVPSKSNVFRVDVRSDYFTILIAFCTPD